MRESVRVVRTLVRVGMSRGERSEEAMAGRAAARRRRERILVWLWWWDGRRELRLALV